MNDLWSFAKSLKRLAKNIGGTYPPPEPGFYMYYNKRKNIHNHITGKKVRMPASIHLWVVDNKGTSGITITENNTVIGYNDVLSETIFLKSYSFSQVNKGKDKLK